MPRSQYQRLWLVGGCMAGLFILVIGYLFLIAPQRDQTSQVNQQVSAAQLQNDTLQARISALAAQNKKLSTYQRALRQAELALPSTSGIPDFLRTLQSIGTATSTQVTSLTVGVPAALAPTTAPTTGSSSASTGTTTTPSPTPSAASTSGSQPGTTAAGIVYSLPITANVSGDVSQLNDFLTQLQSVQPRAVLISQIAEAAVTTTGTAANGAVDSTLVLTMQAFVVPASAAESQQLAAAAGK